MLQMLKVHACTHVLSVGWIHTSLVLEEEPRDGKATLRIHAGIDQRSVTVVSVGAVDGHAQDAVSEGGCEVEYLLYLLYMSTLLCRHACGRGVCVLCVCCVCVCVCVSAVCVCVSRARICVSPAVCCTLFKEQ